MISRYCIIRNQTIVNNGTRIYSGEGLELDRFLDEAYAFLKIDYPKFYKMDNLSKLGFLAAECLLKDRKLMDEYRPEDVAVVLSNANSSLDTDLRYLESSRTIASPALFVYTLPNIVAGEICIRHKIKGENAFFILPSFDADFLFEYTSILINPNSEFPISNSQPPIPDSQFPTPNPQSSKACISGWVDVMGGQHDVFLYLLEKNKTPLVGYSPEKLKELYNNTLWKN